MGKLKLRLSPKEQKGLVAGTLGWHVCTDLQLNDQTRALFERWGVSSFEIKNRFQPRPIGYNAKCYDTTLQTFAPTPPPSLHLLVCVSDGIFQQSNKSSFTALYWPLVEAQMLCLYFPTSNIPLNKIQLKQERKSQLHFSVLRGAIEIKEDFRIKV